MEVRIFTVKDCKFCEQAKAFLKSKGIEYKEFDMGVGGNPDLQKMKRMFKLLGLKSYPVTLVKEGQIMLQGFNEAEFVKAFGDKND